MIDTILLDIDGVCNRFQYHILRSLGVPYNDDSDYPVECGWDIVKAANVLLQHDHFTPETFWTSITRTMWATIPVSVEFEALLDWAQSEVGKDRVYFLTSPTLSPDSLSGKLDWIQRFTPLWVQRQFMIGPSKHLCANSSTLLIDDSDKNVEAFIKAGGVARLMPRPWNSLHGGDPLCVLGDNHASTANDS